MASGTILSAQTPSPWSDNFRTGPKVAFDKLSDGKDLGFAAVTVADYKSTIELIEFVDKLKRKKQAS